MEEVRIQKVIAQAGIASRRKAEELIQDGLVRLNGAPVTLGQRMTVGVDHLEVDGKRVKLHAKPQRVVYAFYKPRNCVTTLEDPQNRPTVKDFFPHTKERLFPIGRLDYDTEGLLLLTNDGEFAQQISHPKFKMWKTYFVKVKGLVPPVELGKIRKGLRMGRKQFMPAKTKILHTVHDKTWLEVSLQEGKNQQIKRMFKYLGFPVLKIKRFRIGNVNLGEMTPGMSRRLSYEEADALLGKKS